LTLAPGVFAGYPLPTNARPLSHCPLLILVGVTGVGKSSTLRELETLGVRFTLLPDRRLLTDQLIIAALRAADGLPAQAVTDRKERFDYTRRFREMHRGGMAETLPALAVDAAAVEGLLIFDGLRGANEVEAAARRLPHARFVLLDAPDAVRVVRLLGRHDPFDRVESHVTPFDGATLEAAGLAGEEAQRTFTPGEQRMLLELVERGAVAVQELRARVEIVLAERRNYDPVVTRAALEAYAGAHARLIDTTHQSASGAAAQIAASLRQWWPEADFT
jgi:hypothetical protein